MKITDKMLSIPPYISTHWGNVKSLQMKGPFLVIILTGGETINIPNLKSDVVELVFSNHASYLENNDFKEKPESFNPNESDVSFKLEMGAVDGINGNPLMHNPAQKDAPDIPPQVLQKVAALAKVFSPEDFNNMPKAEPHCNCLHCQIIKTITGTQEVVTKTELKEDEEVVQDEDLEFQQWEITQTGDKLFNVTNRLDALEKYSVYLGHPVGCTCGRQSCEHIVAVLKS
jgi:hypothetical protein